MIMSPATSGVKFFCCNMPTPIKRTAIPEKAVATAPIDCPLANALEAVSYTHLTLPTILRV